MIQPRFNRTLGGRGSVWARALARGARDRPSVLFDHVLGKQVVGVGHRLKLERVSGRVLEEHRPLLARLALEPQVRLDHKGDALRLEPVCQRVEVVHRQRGSKVGHWNIVAIHRVVKLWWKRQMGGGEQGCPLS